MKTKQEKTEKTILLNAADQLMHAQQELDELTVQLALGKAEVLDKFEEIKKQFRNRTAELKSRLQAEGLLGISKDMKARIEKLEMALTERKTENREMFVAQKKLIQKSLLLLEAEVIKHLPKREDMQHFLKELETFRMKLEILRLRFELKRFAIHEKIHHDADEVRRRINSILFKAHKATEKANTKLKDLKNQIKVSYRNWGS